MRAFRILKLDFLKVVKLTNKKIPRATLLTAKLNGIVESTKRIGIKELLPLFSFIRF